MATKKQDYDEVRGGVPSFMRDADYIAPIENDYVETNYFLTDEARSLLGFLRGGIERKTVRRLEALPRVDNEISEIIEEIKPYIRPNNK